MHTSFKIESKQGNYEVEIFPNYYQNMNRDTEDKIIFCDEIFYEETRKKNEKVISIKSVENSKSLEEMSSIIVKMRDFGVNRNYQIIAIGGGVVQDIATFCANMYMRGLKWHYIPTTLLGMVDSCIGGKSSINVGNYKNIVGSFWPPSKIFIDSKLTTTLNTEQWCCGLIEAAKICYARGKESYTAFEALNPHVFMSANDAEGVISLSLQCKKWFIEVDEFDKKERLLLNFGHTFGHALEAASNFKISHGIGVGLGCLAALEFAKLIGINTKEINIAIRYRELMIDLLGNLPELPSIIKDIDVNIIIEKFKSDKKHLIDKYSIVTINNSGSLELIRIDKNDKSDELLVASYLKSFEALLQNDLISN